jgi:hypothetical protein
LRNLRSDPIFSECARDGGTDRSANEPRLEERRLRRLKHGQLYSAGRDSPGD